MCSCAPALLARDGRYERRMCAGRPWQRLVMYLLCLTAGASSGLPLCTASCYLTHRGEFSPGWFARMGSSKTFTAKQEEKENRLGDLLTQRFVKSFIRFNQACTRHKSYLSLPRGLSLRT